MSNKAVLKKARKNVLIHPFIQILPRIGNPVYSWPIHHPSFVEINSVVFVLLCWQKSTNQQTDTGENKSSSDGGNIRNRYNDTHCIKQSNTSGNSSVVLNKCIFIRFPACSWLRVSEHVYVQKLYICFVQFLYHFYAVYRILTWG